MCQNFFEKRYFTVCWVLTFIEENVTIYQTIVFFFKLLFSSRSFFQRIMSFSMYSFWKKKRGKRQKKNDTDGTAFQEVDKSVLFFKLSTVERHAGKEKWRESVKVPNIDRLPAVKVEKCKLWGALQCFYEAFSRCEMQKERWCPMLCSGNSRVTHAFWCSLISCESMASVFQITLELSWIITQRTCKLSIKKKKCCHQNHLSWTLLRIHVTYCFQIHKLYQSFSFLLLSCQNRKGNNIQVYLVRYHF